MDSLNSYICRVQKATKQRKELNIFGGFDKMEVEKEQKVEERNRIQGIMLTKKFRCA